MLGAIVRQATAATMEVDPLVTCSSIWRQLCTYLDLKNDNYLDLWRKHRHSHLLLNLEITTYDRVSGHVESLSGGVTKNLTTHRMH